MKKDNQKENAYNFLSAFFVAIILQFLTAFVSYPPVSRAVVYAIFASIILNYTSRRLNENHSPLVKWLKKHFAWVLGVVYFIILIILQQ